MVIWWGGVVCGAGRPAEGDAGAALTACVQVTAERGESAWRSAGLELVNSDG